LSLAIEKALLRTPLDRGIALTMRRDEIERPLVTQQPDGSWIASIYVVRKNGLPLWLPRSAKRHRAKKFVATFTAEASELANMMRARSAAKILLETARVAMKRHRGGMKAARTRRRSGVPFFKGPGRPPGIPRAMEKTGSNRDRNCVSCGRRHYPRPCQI